MASKYSLARLSFITFNSSLHLKKGQSQPQKVTLQLSTLFSTLLFSPSCFIPYTLYVKPLSRCSSAEADQICFRQLPQNWVFVRSLLVPHLPFPTSFYRPAQLRESAQELVTSLHPDWWGLGGESEKEEEMQKKRKKALLDTGVEGLKERREEARKEGKERMKKTFGEGKVCFCSCPLISSSLTQFAINRSFPLLAKSLPRSRRRSLHLLHRSFSLLPREPLILLYLSKLLAHIIVHPT